jgi:hypothetical protein
VAQDDANLRLIGLFVLLDGVGRKVFAQPDALDDRVPRRAEGAPRRSDPAAFLRS